MRDVPFFMCFLLSACAGPRSYTAGDSMIPTLAMGQRVGVDQHETAPVRGRVIVFRAPERPDREYVKRIIGLPGDTITGSDDQIVLNGTPIPRCRVGPYGAGEIWLEALDGGRWLVFHSAAEHPMPSGPWTVAPGEVFVIGDNRENSHDSRFWADGKGGGLPLRFIVGAAIGVGKPALPKGTEQLEPELARCMATLSHD
jgi:signal peptidase I